jgi:NAD(P)H-dependent FMN reductase
MSAILGISGSLRKGSYNTALLRAAKGAAPDGTGVEIASIRGIPVVGDDSSRFLAPELVEAPRVTQMRPPVRAISSLRIR